MQIRTPLILSVLLIVAMVAVSLYFAQVLPPDVSGALPGVFYHGPVMAVFITLLMVTLSRKFPGSGLESNVTAFTVGWMSALVLIFASHCLILIHARDHSVNTSVAIQLVLATVIMVQGCFLGHIRRNRFLGVRTPWTHNCDYAWQKTNQIGGGLMVFWGLVWAGWLLTQPQFSPVPVIAVAAVTVFALYPLSFCYARHELKAG